MSTQGMMSVDYSRTRDASIDNPWVRAASGCVVFAAAAPLLLPLGDWWALAALLVWGLLLLTAHRPFVDSRPVAFRLMIGALVAFTLAEALAATWHGTWPQAWPMVAIGALAALTWCCWSRLVVPLASLWIGFALAGIGVGGWALWQSLVVDVTRADGHAEMHAILFGNLGLLSGLLCFAGLAWVWHQRVAGRLPLWWWWLLGAGAGGGLLASLLSGTRGGWIAMPLALLVFYRGYAYRWPLVWRGSALFGLVVFAALAYAIPQTGVQLRVGAAVEEVQDYQDGEARGSVGMRLEMYRGAGMLILEQPWVGRGHDGYQPAMQELVDEQRLPPGLGRYWHAHNDLMDAWVRRGLPGLLAVVALYALPLWHFSRRLRTTLSAQRSIAVAGLLIPVAFIDFGLSYAFFAYPVGIAVYACWLLLFWRASDTGHKAQPKAV